MFLYEPCMYKFKFVFQVLWWLILKYYFIIALHLVFNEISLTELVLAHFFPSLLDRENLEQKNKVLASRNVLMKILHQELSKTREVPQFALSLWSEFASLRELGLRLNQLLDREESKVKLRGLHCKRLFNSYFLESWLHCFVVVVVWKLSCLICFCCCCVVVGCCEWLSSYNQRMCWSLRCFLVWSFAIKFVRYFTPKCV